MKTLILGAIAIFAFTSIAFADGTRTYTEKDFDQFTQDGALRFAISQQAESALQNSCGKPALASLAGAILEQAKDDGVDLPEEIDVDQAFYFLDAGYLMVSSGGVDYSIMTAVTPSGCKAYPATKPYAN